MVVTAFLESGKSGGGGGGFERGSGIGASGFWKEGESF